MWVDSETRVDYLNFATVADSVVELIEQAGGKPLSIGVQHLRKIPLSGNLKCEFLILCERAECLLEAMQNLCKGDLFEADFKFSCLDL